MPISSPNSMLGHLLESSHQRAFAIEDYISHMINVVRGLRMSRKIFLGLKRVR